MSIRGIRGATTVSADEPELILEATRELLEAILDANESMKPIRVAADEVEVVGVVMGLLRNYRQKSRSIASRLQSPR